MKICVISVYLFAKIYILILQGSVKLAKYGLYHMTGYGTDVSFPIGSVHLLFALSCN